MIKRGEIYFVDLDPTQGREQAGRRPVLVLSSNRLNSLPLVVTVVAGTKGENITKDYPTHVRVPAERSGLPIETVFVCFQLRAIDHRRFPSSPAGRLNEDDMADVEATIRLCLEL